MVATLSYFCFAFKLFFVIQGWGRRRVMTSAEVIRFINAKKILVWIRKFRTVPVIALLIFNCDWFWSSVKNIIILSGLRSVRSVYLSSQWDFSRGGEARRLWILNWLDWGLTRYSSQLWYHLNVLRSSWTLFSTGIYIGAPLLLHMICIL